MRRASNTVAIIRKKNKKDKSNEAGIDATALWDPWDASPPALEIVATKYIWPPPTFATDSFFLFAGSVRRLSNFPRKPSSCIQGGAEKSSR